MKLIALGFAALVSTTASAATADLVFRSPRGEQHCYTGSVAIEDSEFVHGDFSSDGTHHVVATCELPAEGGTASRVQLVAFNVVEKGQPVALVAEVYVNDEAVLSASSIQDTKVSHLFLSSGPKAHGGWALNLDQK